MMGGAGVMGVTSEPQDPVLGALQQHLVQDHRGRDRLGSRGVDPGPVVLETRPTYLFLCNLYLSR